MTETTKNIRGTRNSQEKHTRQNISRNVKHPLQTRRHRKHRLKLNPQPVEVPDTELLQLPDHLRRTYLTVVSKGECDATVVSNLTGRCRAIESSYLNQLTRMGWLNKRRISKTIHSDPSAKKSLNDPFLTHYQTTRWNQTCAKGRKDKTSYFERSV